MKVDKKYSTVAAGRKQLQQEDAMNSSKDEAQSPVPPEDANHEEDASIIQEKSPKDEDKKSAAKSKEDDEGLWSHGKNFIIQDDVTDISPAAAIRTSNSMNKNKELEGKNSISHQHCCREEEGEKKMAANLPAGPPLYTEVFRSWTHKNPGSFPSCHGEQCPWTQEHQGMIAGTTGGQLKPPPLSLQHNEQTYARIATNTAATLLSLQLPAIPVLFSSGSHVDVVDRGTAPWPFHQHDLLNTVSSLVSSCCSINDSNLQQIALEEVEHHEGHQEDVNKSNNDDMNEVELNDSPITHNLQLATMPFATTTKSPAFFAATKTPETGQGHNYHWDIEPFPMTMIDGNGGLCSPSISKNTGSAAGPKQLHGGAGVTTRTPSVLTSDSCSARQGEQQSPACIPLTCLPCASARFGKDHEQQEISGSCCDYFGGEGHREKEQKGESSQQQELEEEYNLTLLAHDLIENNFFHLFMELVFQPDET